MRTLLLSLLLLGAPAARAADPLTVPAQKADDPSSSTNTADQWKATKANNEMFAAPVDEFGVTTQSNAFILQLNTLTSCATTSFEGRKDSECLASPNHPECIGMNVALENAVCSTPGYVPKDDTECKKPNLKDYTADEWTAFGGQYFTGIQHCVDVRKNTPLYDAKRLQSLTDMAGDTKGASGASAFVATSDVSGTVKPAPVDAALTVNPSLTDIRIPNDGSTLIGYENGEILKRASKGESFYTVINESPVVEAFKPKARKLIERGLLEPNLVLDQARMNGRLPSLGENLDEYAKATDRSQDKLPPGDEYDRRSDILEGRVGLAKEASWSDSKPVAKVAEIEAAKPAAAPSAEPAVLPAAPVAVIAEEPRSERRRTLSERIALIEANAKRAQKAKAASRSPANAATAMIDENLTLFERVALNYRRQASNLVEAQSPSVSALSVNSSSLKP